MKRQLQKLAVPVAVQATKVLISKSFFPVAVFVIFFVASLNPRATDTLDPIAAQ